jgi:hypothetical protein
MMSHNAERSICPNCQSQMCDEIIEAFVFSGRSWEDNYGYYSANVRCAQGSAQDLANLFFPFRAEKSTRFGISNFRLCLLHTMNYG